MLKTPFPDSRATIPDTTFLKSGIGWSITKLSIEFGFGLDPELGFLLLLFPLVLLVESLGGGLGFDAGLPAEKMEYEASKMVILCSVINRKSRAYLVHGGPAQRKRLSSSSRNRTWNPRTATDTTLQPWGMNPKSSLLPQLQT